MKRWFTRRRKATPSRAAKANPTYVDSEETIVINMSAEEHFAPDEVRVQLDPDANNRERTGPTPASATTDVDGDQTQIWTAGEGVSDRAKTLPEAPAATAAIDVGVTAGLLILVDGPQRGRVFAVKLGRNRIGRGAQNDIVLDTGDPAVSQDEHVVLAADPKNQQFFVVPGNSTNLAYIDDQPLLESREIADKSVIQIGETKFVFVQLFGNYFAWR